MESFAVATLLSLACTVIGAMIGFGGSLLVAWYQAKKSRELAEYDDRLSRKREFDREEREHRWNLQRLAAERAEKPLLRLGFERANAKCLFPHDYQASTEPSGAAVRHVTSTKTVPRRDWYVSILATNIGGSTATNCIGELLKLERIVDGQLVDEPLHGPLTLKWANDKRDVDLAIADDIPLNIVIAREPNTPLEVQLRDVNSELLRQACAKMGTLVFTVGVRADGVNEQRVRLTIKWDGTWSGHWNEDVIWAE